MLLAPPIAAIIAGLTLCAASGMLCQTISTGYVSAIAREGRLSVGGSMGALLGGFAWQAGGWPACLMLVVAMLAAMALIAALAYRGVSP